MTTKTTRLKVGDGIAIKYAKGGNSTALEQGKVQSIRRGIPRTIVIAMHDGSTICLLAETPKPDQDENPSNWNQQTGVPFAGER